MTKTLSLFALAAALGCGVPAPSARADDAAKKPAEGKVAEAKETTVKGTAKCAKCSLNEAKACQAVLVATEGGKDVKYWVEGPAAEKLNEEVCGSEKANVTLTGKVTEKDGKKVITAAKAG